MYNTLHSNVLYSAAMKNCSKARRVIQLGDNHIQRRAFLLHVEGNSRDAAATSLPVAAFRCVASQNWRWDVTMINIYL